MLVFGGVTENGITDTFAAFDVSKVLFLILKREKKLDRCEILEKRR